MALKAIVTEEEFSSLPDPIKAEYGEAANGKRQLQVTSVEGFELADNAKLKSALSKEKKAADDAKKLLKSFEGLDADAARDALKKIEEFEGMDPEAKAAELLKAKEKLLSDKFEKDREGLTKKWQTELEAAKTERDKIKRDHHTMVFENTLTKSITKEKGIPSLLIPLALREGRVNEETGKLEFFGPDGEVLMSPKPGSTDPMTPDEWVITKKNSTEFSRAFDGTGASGSGAGASDANGKAPYVLSKSDAGDYRKFDAAEQAAKKAGRELVIQ